MDQKRVRDTCVGVWVGVGGGGWVWVGVGGRGWVGVSKTCVCVCVVRVRVSVLASHHLPLTTHYLLRTGCVPRETTLRSPRLGLPPSSAGGATQKLMRRPSPSAQSK